MAGADIGWVLTSAVLVLFKVPGQMTSSITAEDVETAYHTGSSFERVNLGP